RDWEGLLKEKLDGVIVASTPRSHIEVAQRFVNAGVAVLVEKPLCLDLGAAQRFREEVERRRVVARVDHIHLYNPALAVLRRLSPSLGRIVSIEASAGREGPFRGDVASLWDWGPHPLSMIFALTGRESQRAEARRTLREPEGGGWAENWELRLVFEDGAE